MLKFVSIRTKFINLSTKIMVATAGALCFVGVVFSIFIANKTLANIEDRIFSATIEKGNLLIANNCLALSTLAQENSFLNIRQLVATTITIDRDLRYGIYMDDTRQPWVYAKADNPLGEVVEKTTLNDSVSRWAADLLKPEFKEVDRGETIEFAGPVVAPDGKKLGTVRYGLTTAALHASISTAQRGMYYSIIKSCLVILLIGFTIFLVSTREARRQANTITLPIQQLTDAVHTIADGNYAVPLSLVSNDEIGMLAGKFEKMRQTIQQYTDNLEHMVAQRTGELHDAMDELKRSNIELEQFAYVTSHDLREPLRMITSYIHLLKKRYNDKLDSNARAFIAFTVEGVERMQELIDDLLTYSRLGSKAKPFEPVDCAAVFDVVVKNLEIAISEKKASVAQSGLPVVLAEWNQMIQVFQNLIANAVKFCKTRSPQISVSARESEGVWEFSVKDNGIGIAPQYWETVFQIFQRLHTREEYQGTGIGLAICKKIVERHGGKIWLESQLGLGTTFFFTIPNRPIEPLQVA